ncbi:MAG: PD40 domain-containing protein [Candidatus Eisenbacteria bacterium]|uniref:PD40 domain-containing protein n=1 Tax=Eiseniibacteriota bacterium TaxID=2212470 RepID=A0A956NJL4_UNCEI|nr:PD40 domain-containing protein [Candidatus Eisenbacteria bacterium]
MQLAETRGELRPAPQSATSRSWLHALLLFALALLATSGLSSVSFAQPYSTFGKNKVQYNSWEWNVLESEHFDLYFYAEEEGLARIALEMAEDAFEDLQPKFGHQVKRRVPLIIYNSFQDFEQNNITPYFLPEGVAGLTEFARGRVLVPFNGSLSDFRTTIHHELVHVYQLSLIAEVYKAHFRQPFLSPPLWWSEGLAVHFTETRDPEADMILRDMVVSGGLPPIDEFWRYAGSFLTYKLGQSVLDYIGTHYGEDRIPEVYRRLYLHDSFADVLHDVLGVSQSELSERWAYDLQTRYYPDVANAEPARFSSKVLTGDGGANMKAVPLPDSLGGVDKGFLFLSPRDGFTNVYRGSRRGKERDVETLIKGERSPGFESLHLFRNRLDVSPDGKLLLVSKHQDRDEIVVFDVVSKKEEARFGWPELVGLLSPSWAPDQKRFVFSGLSRDGYSDLYLYDIENQQLRRLTHDRFQDIAPSFCPWAEKVVFSSDRTPGGRGGTRNLFVLDLDTGALQHLTRGSWTDSSPVWDPNDRSVLFVSDRDRFYGVYRVDEEGRGHKLTRSLDAILDPRPLPDGSGFLASVYRRGTFQVYEFSNPDTLGPAVDLMAATGAPWEWEEASPTVEPRKANYSTRFSLDFAQGGLLVDPSLRSGEGLQIVMSDLMSNHLIAFDLANTTFSTSEFLDNFSAGFTYLNLKRRLNYGLSAFHYSGNFYDNLSLPYFERRSGASVLLSYPLSKFERFQTSFTLAYSETDRPSIGFERKGAVGTHFVSFIHDNSLWIPTGPIDGHRLNITAGLRLNLKEGSEESTYLLGDYRRYFRVGTRSTYAVRLQGRWSDGPNPEFYWIGGSHGMRTYDRRQIAGKRTLMLNQEVRFPLVRGLVLGLPMGNLELPGVEGAVYFDAGSGWDEDWPPDFLGGYGVGFRMGFGGYLVLRLDVGRRTDFESFGKETHTRFYIGWDY